jgi:hypothetical protein
MCVCVCVCLCVCLCFLLRACMEKLAADACMNADTMLAHVSLYARTKLFALLCTRMRVLYAPHTGAQHTHAHTSSSWFRHLELVV